MTGEQAHRHLADLIALHQDCVATGRDAVDVVAAQVVIRWPPREVAVMLAVTVAWLAPPSVDTVTLPPAASVLMHLVDLYSAAVYEGGGPACGPWPDDPDGGEIRIIMALRSMLDAIADADRMNPSTRSVVSTVGLRRIVNVHLTEGM